MTEGFLARWSRRKREADDGRGTADRPEARQEAGPTVEPAPKREPETEPARAEPGAPAVDVTQLPAIESIGAGTDIRAFLAPGVPAELTRAALRRAWSADPAIRDFIGLVENGWDFNAPDGVPGFGPFEMTEQMRTLVADMIGGSESRSREVRSVASATNMEQTLSPSEQTAAAKSPDGTQRPAADSAGDGDDVKKMPASAPDRSEIFSGQEPTAAQEKDTATQYPRDASRARDVPIRRGGGRALPE